MCVCVWCKKIFLLFFSLLVTSQKNSFKTSLYLHSGTIVPFFFHTPFSQKKCGSSFLTVDSSRSRKSKVKKKVTLCCEFLYIYIFFYKTRTNSVTVTELVEHISYLNKMDEQGSRELVSTP